MFNFLRHWRLKIIGLKRSGLLYRHYYVWNRRISSAPSSSNPHPLTAKCFSEQKTSSLPIFPHFNLSNFLTQSLHCFHLTLRGDWSNNAWYHIPATDRFCDQSGLARLLEGHMRNWVGKPYLNVAVTIAFYIWTKFLLKKLKDILLLTHAPLVHAFRNIWFKTRYACRFLPDATSFWNNLIPLLNIFLPTLTSKGIWYIPWYYCG